MTEAASSHPIVWLHHAGQHLGLVPTLGGSVAAWQADRPEGPLDLWRPWDGTPDLYRLASFPMVPWSNRIAGGGFAGPDGWFDLTANSPSDPLPIHGSAWQQPWQVIEHSATEIVLQLDSRQPFAYRALQRFRLHGGRLDLDLQVTHLDERAAPLSLRDTRLANDHGLERAVSAEAGLLSAAVAGSACPAAGHVLARAASGGGGVRQTGRCGDGGHGDRDHRGDEADELARALDPFVLQTSRRRHRFLVAQYKVVKLYPWHQATWRPNPNLRPSCRFLPRAQ